MGFEEQPTLTEKGRERARWSVTWRDDERATRIESRGDAELRFRQTTAASRNVTIRHRLVFFSLFLLFQNQTIRVGCLGVLNLYFTVLILFF